LRNLRFVSVLAAKDAKMKIGVIGGLMMPGRNAETQRGTEAQRKAVKNL